MVPLLQSYVLKALMESRKLYVGFEILVPSHLYSRIAFIKNQ